MPLEELRPSATATATKADPGSELGAIRARFRVDGDNNIVVSQGKAVEK